MILMMGIAGSGKGTQGAKLAEQYGLTVISMGDAIKANLTDDQRQAILAGHLLNDQETIIILDKVLSELSDQDKVILDGFPRTQPQAEWLLEQAKTGRFTIDHIIHLVASQDAVLARLLNRARTDDTEEAIKKRFKWYHDSTEPILSWFADHDLTVSDINAEQSVEAVTADLVKLLANA